MRLSASLLFALSPCVVLAERSAQVYFLPPNPTTHQQPPALNAFEANTLISHHLGFDVYESIGDRIEGWWNDLTSLVHGHSTSKLGGIGEGPQDSVLIVIHSNHPEDFMPTTIKQSFIISDAPEASVFSDLIHAYTERAHQIFDSVFQPVIESITSTDTYKSLLDIFDLAAEAGGMFVEEFGRLVQLVEAEIEGKKTENSFATVEIKSLAQMPRNSEEYVTAVKSVQTVLGNPSLQNKKAAVIVVPPESVLGRRADYSSPQVSELVQPITTSGNKVVFSVSTCFASNETCSTSTNDCSGHGACSPVTKAGRTCYTCSCAITKNDQGRRQWWAGQSCEKLDLSTPFTLLAGTAIALVVLALFSVYLLLGVGEEPLPNTLTLSAMPHSSKRD